MNIQVNVKVKPRLLINNGLGEYSFRKKSDIMAYLKYSHKLNMYSNGSERYFTKSHFHNGKEVGRSVVVVNFEKRRPKFDRTLITRGKNKNKMKVTKVYPGHWVAYLYEFNEDLIKFANLKFLQGDRTFTLL